MKASPLAVFLSIVIILLVVIPGIFAFFSPYFRGSMDYWPIGSFTHAQKANDTTENVFFGNITPEARPSEIWIVIESFSWRAEYAMPWNRVSGPLALERTFGSSYSDNITSIIYTDLDQDEWVSSGDYITITLSHEGLGSEVYRVFMVAYAVGTALDDISFTW
jgi:hypothetical protein